MTVEEYISSGIIERYIVGELSEKERIDVEAMAMQYPEVKAEIELTEATLMNFASKTPPVRLKQKIAGRLDINTAKVIPLNEKKSSSLMWLVAASLLLLVGSSIYNVILTTKLSETEDQLAVINSQNQKFVSDFDAQSKSYGEMAQQMAILMNPNNNKVMLKGMDIAPTALAIVYWNKQNKDVYINVNALPSAADGMQYQLWAIVDGKPVDIGMLDMNPDLPPLHKMKSINGAQAFAVTLEKKGGSPTPNMNAMYLMGNV